MVLQFLSASDRRPQMMALHCRLCFTVLPCSTHKLATAKVSSRATHIHMHDLQVTLNHVRHTTGMNFVANLLIEEVCTVVCRSGGCKCCLPALTVTLVATPLQIGEEPAFWLMVRLLRHHHLRGLYLDKIPILSLFLISFEEYLAVFLPDVRRHLHSCGFHAALYAVEWFTTLFANNLPVCMQCVC